jgi:hypothetical protein
MKGEIHLQTQTDGGGICEERRSDALKCHDAHTMFHEDWLTYSKVEWWGSTETQTAWKSHKPSLNFFKIRKVG